MSHLGLREELELSAPVVEGQEVLEVPKLVRKEGGFQMAFVTMEVE